MSHNVDGYRISTFFNKDRNSLGGKIKAGPVWDYDLAFRNADYCNGSDTAGWAFNFNSVCPDDGRQVPDWWNRFITDTAFQNNLYCRWQQLRGTSLSLSHLYYLIDSIATLTTDARSRHFQKWPVLGTYIWPNPSPIATTYEGEIQTLKTWLADRMNWLDRNIPKRGACYVPPVPSVIVPPVVVIDSSSSIVITVFPNPVSANSNIVIESGKNQPVSLRVTDMIGRTIMRNTINLTRGTNNVTILSSGWSTGIYFFEFVTGDGGKFTKRLLKR